MIFIQLRKFSSITNFLRVFIMYKCWILLKAVSAPIDVIFLLYLFDVLDCIDFQVLPLPF